LWEAGSCVDFDFLPHSTYPMTRKIKMALLPVYFLLYYLLSTVTITICMDKGNLL
jgi:hypothetical protein